MSKENGWILRVILASNLILYKNDRETQNVPRMIAVLLNKGEDAHTHRVRLTLAVLKQGVRRARRAKNNFLHKDSRKDGDPIKKGCRRMPRTVWAFILTTLQVITRRRNFPLVVKTLSVYSMPTVILFISVAFSASRLMSFHRPAVSH